MRALFCASFATTSIVLATACTSRTTQSGTQSATVVANRGAPVTSRSSGASDARDPSPVRLAPPSVSDRTVSAVEQATRWTTANGLTVEHRRFALASTVSVRLVVRGQSAEPASGLGLRDALRLAAALEQGATRRNAAPLFIESLDQLGAELRVDAGRQGLVLSLDVASRNAISAIRRLGELASEPVPSREIPAFGDWVSRRLSSMRARTDASDAIVSARRAALESLRGLDAPWSPREWSDAATTWSWGAATTDDSQGRALVRAMFRAQSMTLVVAGDLSLDDARGALTDRWAAVARGAGLAVGALSPVAATDSDSLRAGARASTTSSLALGYSLVSDARPSTLVALRVAAPILERCASRDVRASFYDDPVRPVLALATTIDAAANDLSTRAATLANEPARALASPCADAEFVTARNALIDLVETDDSARWADARAWARHDAIEPVDHESMIAALGALDLERTRAAFRAAFSGATRSIGLAAPAGQETALCAVMGVRAIRVGATERACPR